MLDMYWSHNLVEDDSPPTDQLILRLSMDEHRSLAVLWSLAERQSVGISFYEDGVLEREKVKILSGIIDGMFRRDNNLHLNSLLVQFYTAVSTAIEMDAMILSYCD